MGVWARFSELISANVNALLDRAEDPERMLAQVIREMEEGLSAARRQAAIAIAAARRLSRELEQSRAASRHWHEQARLAWTTSREDLARQALGRKIEHDDAVRLLEGQFAAAQQSSAEVKRALHALEARVADARRKQRLLAARQRVATVRLEAQRAAGLALPDAATLTGRFAHFEDRLVDLEDQLLAEVEVIRGESQGTDELAELATKRRIDEELQALVREIETGSQPPSTP